MGSKNILIIGGGAGGLPLATFLGRRLGKRGLANITLVDTNTSHIWKPRFHEVATGAIDADLDAVDYRGHARLNGYRFEPGSLVSLDANEGTITLAAMEHESGQQVLPERTLPYDYLVLAIGSRSNDFGTPGVKTHSLFMDSRQQADRFREQFLSTCLQANYQKRPLSIAIVGGGATGVELAAEIHHAIDLLKLYGHDQLDRKQASVHIIEAAPRILPALPEQVAMAATRELESLGVHVHANTLVECAEEDGFITKGGGKIEAELLVWAAGVKAPDFLKKLNGLQVNRINQIEVETNLQAKGQPNIFAMGDCAACILPGSERPLPPRAQTAQQQAHHLAKELERLIVFNREPRPFVYKDHGSLVSLSRFSSVGSLMGNLKRGNFFVEGWMARIMYISLYRLHQAALYGWPRTLLLMLAGKFNKMIRPRLKLH